MSLFETAARDYDELPLRLRARLAAARTLDEVDAVRVAVGRAISGTSSAEWALVVSRVEVAALTPGVLALVAQGAPPACFAHALDRVTRGTEPPGGREALVNSLTAGWDL